MLSVVIVYALSFLAIIAVGSLTYMAKKNLVVYLSPQIITFFVTMFLLFSFYGFELNILFMFVWTFILIEIFGVLAYAKNQNIISIFSIQMITLLVLLLNFPYIFGVVG